MYRHFTQSLSVAYPAHLAELQGGRRMRMFTILACLNFLLCHNAFAQNVDCQAILNSLLNAPPGVYSPGQAQDMADVYNRECLGQQTQYQSPPQYNQQQQGDADAEAFGQLLGTILGGALGRR